MRYFFLLVMLGLVSLVTAQSIMLKNPSFEGSADLPQSLFGWASCSRGSTPDVLPGQWNVYLPAQDGGSYIGLITREDGTYEEIVQELPLSLKQNECYKLSLWLAHADTYVGYNLPVRLRIWNCDKNCKKLQLLATSKLISNTFWEQVIFFMDTKVACKYLLFEAYYGPGIFIPYRGNILIDNVSLIEKCRRA